jgi:hypothetical protein
LVHFCSYQSHPHRPMLSCRLSLQLWLVRVNLCGYSHRSHLQKSRVGRALRRQVWSARVHLCGYPRHPHLQASRFSRPPHWQLWSARVHLCGYPRHPHLHASRLGTVRSLKPEEALRTRAPHTALIPRDQGGTRGARVTELRKRAAYRPDPAGSGRYTPFLRHAATETKQTRRDQKKRLGVARWVPRRPEGEKRQRTAQHIREPNTEHTGRRRPI